MWQLVGESCIHRVQGYWDTIEGGIERERKCTSTKHKCSTKKPAWKGDEVRPGVPCFETKEQNNRRQSVGLARRH